MWLLLIIFSILNLASAGKGDQYFDPSYKNNYYILLSSSKFYFNYRHSTNTLTFYKYLKEAGVTDDRIILMLPENHACNSRNPFGVSIYPEESHKDNLYCDDI